MKETRLARYRRGAGGLALTFVVALVLGLVLSLEDPPELLSRRVLVWLSLGTLISLLGRALFSNYVYRLLFHAKIQAEFVEAKAAMRTKDFRTAGAGFERVLRHANPYGDWYPILNVWAAEWFLGVAHEEQGELEEAMACYWAARTMAYQAGPPVLEELARGHMPEYGHQSKIAIATTKGKATSAR